MPPTLNFGSLVSVNNFPKSTTPRSPPLTLLETSASYLMNTSLFPIRSHLSPNLAISIFVSFAVSVHTSIPKQLPPLPLSLFTSSLTNATLSQPAQVSDHPVPTDPELSCTCGCQTPKSSYITPILRSLHWLKITERIEYKLLSLTYKVLTTTQPCLLYTSPSPRDRQKSRMPSSA